MRWSTVSTERSRAIASTASLIARTAPFEPSAIAVPRYGVVHRATSADGPTTPVCPIGRRAPGLGPPPNLDPPSGGFHDPAPRPLGHRAAPAVRPRSRRRGRRSGADGRSLRRAVHVHELHVPVVQLPQ